MYFNLFYIKSIVFKISNTIFTVCGKVTSERVFTLAFSPQQKVLLLRLKAAAESSFTFIHRAQCIKRSSSRTKMSPSFAGQRMNKIFTNACVTEPVNRCIGWELIIEEMTALIWSTLHQANPMHACQHTTGSLFPNASYLQGLLWEKRALLDE